jgi:hypothetical protein
MNKSDLASQILYHSIQRNKPVFSAQINDHVMIDGKGGIKHALRV